MLKTATRLALLCALLTALPASAQAPAGTSGPAEAQAWRGFQACLQVSRGVSLDKAAAEAGFLKDDRGWTVDVADRSLSIELAKPPSPPEARACLVVSRGPLVDHAGFGKRLGAWAAKEGFAAPVESVTAGGGQTVRYFTPDGARAVVLAFYPEVGKAEQPTRTILFVGWSVP